MNRTDFEALADRDSELTQDALKQKCMICRANKGRVCVDTISGRPLHEAHERWVHLARILLEGDAA